MLAHMPRARPWFTGRLAWGSVDRGAPGLSYPGEMASTQAVLVPRAPSPLDRPYPVDRATLGSCARPRSSAPLAHRSTVQSGPVGASPCWNPVLPAVLSAPPARRAWTPTPAARGGPSPVSSPPTSAFPPVGPGRSPPDPCRDFRPVALSGLQSFRNVQARRFARHPGRSYRGAPPQGSRDFYIRASRGSLPPPAPDMLAVRIGQLTAGDSHPHKMRSLVGCSPNARLEPLPGVTGPRPPQLCFRRLASRRS